MIKTNNGGNFFWLDPVNTNPHFMDLACRIFTKHGRRICVIANQRVGFCPTPGVNWIFFSSDKVIQPRPNLHFLKKIEFMAEYLYGWIKSVQIIKTECPRHILYTNSTRYSFMQWLFLTLIRRKGIKISVLCHKIQNPSRASWARRYFNLFDSFFVLSSHVEQALQNIYKIDSSCIQILPHPHYASQLDEKDASIERLATLRLWKQDDPLVVYMSAIVDVHGARELPEIWLDIRQKRQNSKLLIMGNDHKSGRSELASYLKESFSEDTSVQIQFGFYSNEEAIAVLQCADVVILPYKDLTPTQSGVIPLAATWGVPSVIFDICGLREQILDGISGEFAPVGDISAFGDKVCNILQSPEKYKEQTLTVIDDIFSEDAFAECIFGVVGS